MKEILDERAVVCNNAVDAFKKVLDTVQDSIEQQDRIDEVERKLVPMLMAVGKAALQDVVEAAGDGDVGETAMVGDTKLKRSREKHNKGYHSIFGKLDIARYVYQIREKTKVLLAPLDAKLGLPANEISYVLEDWHNNLSTRTSYQEAAEFLHDTLGIAVPASTIENRVRKQGEYVESFYEQREPMANQEEQGIIVCTADAKGVPIRRSLENRMEEELGKTPHKRQRKNDYQKSTRRKSVGDKKVRTQRGTVGACYTIERDPRSAEQMMASDDEKRAGEDSSPTPHNKRLWAEMTLIDQEEQEVNRGAERVFASLADEVEQRNPDGEKPVVCVMDGDRSLWKLLFQFIPYAVGILDLYHASEKLWKAAQCFHREGSAEAEAFVRRYLQMLLEGKVDSVRGLFQRYLNQQKLTATKRKHLQEVITYFTTNRDRMRYDEYLAAGYPIGSGVVEGGCKHVIGDRFCLSGMRWEIEGAQPMLDLRVIQLNKEWGPFIKHRTEIEQADLYSQSV